VRPGEVSRLKCVHRTNEWEAGAEIKNKIHKLCHVHRAIQIVVPRFPRFGRVIHESVKTAFANTARFASSIKSHPS
jgi:hypothetical protein